MSEENRSGCWGCKHLDYYEAYFEESGGSGFMCNERDTEHFKKFPCNRKLKCFEKAIADPQDSEVKDE